MKTRVLSGLVMVPLLADPVFWRVCAVRGMPLSSGLWA